MTRQKLLDAAVAVFAERGYAGASVRAICGRAKANPAAIKYYFGSKEGLYVEVLRTAVAAFGAESRAGDDAIADAEPEEAIRLLIRQQLVPLLRRDKIARYLRVFAWENMAPTATFRRFIATERIPVLAAADVIVGKLLPQAGREERLVATIWLVNQAAPFVRNRDTLSGPPFDLAFDEAFIERLAATLVRLAVGGLSRAR